MDPLSITASVIAVLQATSAVISICYNYTANVSNSSSQQSRVLEEAKSLQNVLEALVVLARDTENTGTNDDSQRPNIQKLKELVEEPLAGCLRELEHLQKRLEPPRWTGKDGSKRQALMQALRWPLNERDTKKALDQIERFKTTLNLALTTHQATLTLAIHTKLEDNQKEIIEDREDSKKKRIRRWLSPPDPSTSHNEACRKRQSTTGNWFVNSQEFDSWKETPNSKLWLHGIPGCGKTVLSSTIIEQLLYDCQSQEGPIHVAYFYFDFNDSEKKRHEVMIRSLITQLSSKCKTTPEKLLDLYTSCGNGQRQPNNYELMEILQHLIKSFDHTYIILDALDECVEREGLLGNIQQITGWQIESLHFLATSRKKSDIDESFEISISRRNMICIQSSLVDEDIRTYVHARIHEDPKLKRWKNQVEVQKEIETALMEKSSGMFRWAVCQLDAIVKCYNLVSLRKALASLPRTLDQTYDRILCSIDEENRQDSLRILQWLVYSARPLGIDELAEILIVDANAEPRVDPDKRFPYPQEALAPCSSLITIVEETKEVRLAHFSVQEYLISSRIEDGPAWQYRVKEFEANEEMAQVCIAYILQFQALRPFPQNALRDFALARYVSKSWIKHTREAEKSDLILELVMELFENKDAYLSIFNLSGLVKEQEFRESSGDPQNTSYKEGIKESTDYLYYASYQGLSRVVKRLVENGADVNAQDGFYGNALQAASYRRDEAIVRLLVENGADVNAQGGRFGNALQAALHRRDEAIIRLLVEEGADVNAQGGRLGNALQAASWHGDEAIVRLLVEEGADVNAQGGRFGTALQAASHRGDEAIIRLLIKEGADVNAQGGYYGNALQAASFRENEAIVRLLIKEGADVNAQGGYYGNTLQAALFYGDKAIVRLLVEEGADVNAQGGEHGSALHAASVRGKEAIVRLLVENGADVNIEDEEHRSALQKASERNFSTIVQFLREHGATDQEEE